MSVPEIWKLSCGKYYGGSKHTNSVYTGNDGSSLLAVSMPRDVGNIMTSLYITEISDSLELTEQTTVRVSNLRGEVGGGEGGRYGRVKDFIDRIFALMS
jgi:hypothetical protein